MAPLLTVGLPVYNSMPYLPETMESLFKQTVSDFEILAVVDDCNDGSVEYMESIRDPRLRILRQPKSGIARALNRLLSECRTPWLVRQDTDDISYPNRLERLLEQVQAHPEAGMFYSAAEYYPSDKCVGQFRCTKGTPEELRKIVESGLLLSFCHPAVLLNVEKTLAVGGYRPEIHVEDADLWWRMALHHPIHFIPDVLVGYRQHSSSSNAHHARRAHVEILYVQYVLLSHLHGWEPLPVEKIRPLLEVFVSYRRLEAKEKLRRANMLLAENHRLTALTTALQSFLTSPQFFIKRVVDEFKPSGPITNGIDPKLFLQRKHEFWPETSKTGNLAVQMSSMTK